MNAQQPSLLHVAAPCITGLAFMIGQILVGGVPFGNAELLFGLIHVPAHEIGRIGDLVAPGAVAACCALIVLPGVQVVQD